MLPRADSFRMELGPPRWAKPPLDELDAGDTTISTDASSPSAGSEYMSPDQWIHVAGNR